MPISDGASKDEILYRSGVNVIVFSDNNSCYYSKSMNYMFANISGNHGKQFAYFVITLDNEGGAVKI